MAPTSDERRDVAERIRTYGSGFDFGDSNPFWYVCKAVFGDVKARTYYDVFNRLADLIDPTCHVPDEEVTHQPTLDAMAVHVYTCDRCNSPFYMGDVCMHPKPLYCPYCGARVVRDDD